MFCFLPIFGMLFSKLTKFNLKNFNSPAIHHTLIRKYRAKILMFKIAVQL